MPSEINPGAELDRQDRAKLYKELQRFKDETQFTKQRCHLRSARAWLGDSTGYGRRKRLRMAMWHCLLGLLSHTP